MSNKFKNDKMELLKTLRSVVDDIIDFSNVNLHLEEEVAEIMIDLTNQRKVRRLKKIRKELDQWIKAGIYEKTDDSSTHD